MQPRSITLNHIAIAVDDLEAALRFYRDALGIQLEGIEDIDIEGVRVAFLPLKGEHAAHPPRIEIVQPTRDGTGIARWLAKHGPGLHHVCVEVDDLDAAMRRAAGHGAQLINETPAKRADGTLYAFIHPRSAFGVLIELYQSARH